MEQQKKREEKSRKGKQQKKILGINPMKEILS
jgi:hypothetical protein